jgi:CPA1 family monovalent cation:H+ antiporter
MHDFEIILGLLLVSTLVQPLARRLDVPLAIAQVVCGLVLSALPFVPQVSFNPELSFTLLVPPLLYRAASSSSLRDTRRQALPIFLLAFALVLITAVAVAGVVRAIVPQLPWPAALVLGAMVSPPDADVTTSIARRLGIPKRLVTIIEGETLLNDATSFITYRFAVRAVMIGTFVFSQAVTGFLTLTAIGIVVGLAVGTTVAQVRKREGDSVGDAVISLVTPFASYLTAERLGGSGVLAVVVTGFCVSRFLPRTIAVRARVRAILVWETVTFIVGGIVFTLIGLQLGQLAPVFWRNGDFSLLWLTMVVSLTIIAVRLLWVFPTARITRAETPSWRSLTVIGWAGLRGGDTLVMALAVPMTTSAGQPFPEREMLVSVALGVVLVTIVLQGLTLRPLIRGLGLPRDTAVETEERKARLVAEQASLKRLDEIAATKSLPPDGVELLRSINRLRTRLDLDDIAHAQGHDGTSNEDILRNTYQEMRDAARAAVVKLRDDEVIGDEALGRVIGDLDLEDLRNADASPA